MRSAARARGFTLVEILIVVVILGILAAIVVPQYGNASERAKGSTTAAQLKSLREAIDRYKVDHDGNYPLAVEGLLVKTDLEGMPSANGPYGPYIVKFPVNPFTNSATFTLKGTEDETYGWVFDTTTMQMYAVGFDENTQTYTAP